MKSIAEYDADADAAVVAVAVNVTFVDIMRRTMDTFTFIERSIIIIIDGHFVIILSVSFAILRLRLHFAVCNIAHCHFCNCYEVCSLNTVQLSFGFVAAKFKLGKLFNIICTYFNGCHRAFVSIRRFRSPCGEIHLDFINRVFNHISLAGIKQSVFDARIHDKWEKSRPII